MKLFRRFEPQEPQIVSDDIVTYDGTWEEFVNISSIGNNTESASNIPDNREIYILYKVSEPEPEPEPEPDA